MSGKRSWRGLGGRAVASSSLLILIALFTASPAVAAKPRSAKAPASLWGVEIDNGSYRLLDKGMVQRLRRSGATLVASPGRLTAARRSKLASLARRKKLSFFAPRRVRGAATLSRATADVVVVRAFTARAFQRLAAANGTTRVAGIVDLTAESYGDAEWQAAVAAAEESDTLDMIVRPSGAGAKRALKSYLGDVSEATKSSPVDTAPTDTPETDPVFDTLLSPPLPCVVNCSDRTAPSQPGNLRATATTRTSVSLAWDASTDNRKVTGYVVFRNGAQVASTSQRTATVSSLACGTTYEFAVEARDAANNASTRARLYVTTSACPDTQPPSVPQGMAFTGWTQTTVTVSWNASTDNVGVAGYRLYRDGQQVATTQGTSYTFTGLTCGRAYEFSLSAYDAAGNASNRLEAAGTRSTSACDPAPDTQPPTAPTNLWRNGGSTTSVGISWTASSDNVGVTGYRVYRDGTLVASPTGTSQAVTGLACGTSYVFGVEARDAAGNTSPRSTLTAATDACAPTTDTQAPSTPTGMAFGTTTQTSVAVSWNASTDNVGVAGYRLYRNGTVVGTTQNLNYTYTGLSCGTSYTLALEAYDAAGNASNRAEATGTATTQACDPDPAPDPQPEPEPDPNPGTASVFVATNGSDGNPCSSSAPCASFDRAYRVAQPGAVVQVAGGTYAAQRIMAVTSRSGPNVVFQPAAGARVVLDGLAFGTGSDRYAGPDFVTVRNMETTYRTAEPGAGNQRAIYIGPGSTNIRLENMDAGSVDTWFADQVTIKGGDFGPCHAVWGSNVCANNKFDVTSNVLIDGATFHDLRFDETCFTVSGADCHWECMYINSSNNFTVRNSKFRGCAIFDIFATISGPDAARVGHRNLRIENNWFAAPWTEGPNNSGQPARSTAVALAWCGNSSLGYRDVTVAFNSFQRNANLFVDRAPGCQFQNTRVVGNLMMRGRCEPDFVYSHNLLTTAAAGSTCSATDRLIGDTLPYVNGSSQTSAMDYHLAGASMADDYVPASVGCPATDIDGTARGTQCTAGSDER
jgi:chitodextrinase